MLPFYTAQFSKYHGINERDRRGKKRKGRRKIILLNRRGGLGGDLDGDGSADLSALLASGGCGSGFGGGSGLCAGGFDGGGCRVAGGSEQTLARFCDLGCADSRDGRACARTGRLDQYLIEGREVMRGIKAYIKPHHVQ